MPNTEPLQGQRLIFPNCRLDRVSVYTGEFRGETVNLFRQTFDAPGLNGQLVYAGKRLPITPGQAVTIKATIKRVEKFGRKYFRISRPILLDNMPAPLLDEIHRNKPE